MREVRVRRRKSRKRPSSTGTKTPRMKIPPLFRRLPHRRMHLLTTHNYRHREDSRRSQRTLPPERSHILSFHFRGTVLRLNRVHSSLLCLRLQHYFCRTRLRFHLLEARNSFSRSRATS